MIINNDRVLYVKKFDIKKDKLSYIIKTVTDILSKRDKLEIVLLEL